MKEWIDVRDALPSVHCHVLMTTTTGNVVSTYFCPGVPYWIKDQKYQGPSMHFEYAAEYGYTVTHWMPLPRSPAHVLNEALLRFLICLIKLEIVLETEIPKIRDEAWFKIHTLKGDNYTSICQD